MTEYEKVSLLYLAYQAQMLHDIGACLRKVSIHDYAKWHRQELERDIRAVASAETLKMLGATPSAEESP